MVIIPGNIREKILNDITAFAKDVRGEDSPDILFDAIVGGASCPMKTGFNRLIAKLEKQPHDLRFLEIGAGYGLSMIECIKQGFNVVGVEPGVEPDSRDGMP